MDMKRGFLACGAISAGLLVAAGLIAGPDGVPQARADDAAAPVNVTSPGCLLKGTSPPPKNMQLFDAPSGGSAFAKLTGGFVPMTLSDIPFDLSSGRARLRTSTGTGAMRLDGYVSISDLPVFTTRDISVYGGSIWISSAQKVQIVRAQSDSLTVELTLAGTMSQTVRATAPCDAFALERGKPTLFEVPGNGRGYMMKKSTIELFDKPNGDVVLTLNMIEGAGQIFWSTESKAGFVHVTGRSDLTVDAWARFRDLDPLKKGEMVDQYIPPSTQVAGAQLQFDKPPPLVRASREIQIRSKRDDKAKPIGVVEQDAEIYIMETVAGWTNILPKHLGIVAPDDGGFWIPASEAPK